MCDLLVAVQRVRPLYGEQLRDKETPCIIQIVSGSFVDYVRGLCCELDILRFRIGLAC
jgi:hypothetical protein